MPQFSKRPEYLSDAFLGRVKRSYRLAMERVPGGEGTIWPQIDLLRRPVHEALMAAENSELRNMFADPITTDLFYGVDNLASTIEGTLAAIPGIDVALPEQARDQITRLAEALGVIVKLVKVK